jgi:hypothetical protein
MASIDLGRALKALKQQRVRIKGELAKLNKAIAALEGPSATNAATMAGRIRKRTVSVAARRRMAKAQKLRWAKLKQEPDKK